MALSSEMIAAIAKQHGLLQENVAATKPAANALAAKAFMGVEVLLGSALAGYVNGRFASEGKDHFAPFGLPADVVASAALFGASVLGMFGNEYDIHIAAFASGVAGGAAYREAFAKGASARVEQEEGQRLLRAEAPQKGLGEGNATRSEGAEVIPLAQKGR